MVDQSNRVVASKRSCCVAALRSQAPFLSVVSE